MKQTYDGQVASSSKYLNISTTKVNFQKSDTITKLGIPQPTLCFSGTGQSSCF